jgi:hypothetical protein
LADYLDGQQAEAMRNFGVAGGDSAVPIVGHLQVATREFVMGLRRASPHVSGILEAHCTAMLQPKLNRAGFNRIRHRHG